MYISIFPYISNILGGKILDPPVKCEMNEHNVHTLCGQPGKTLIPLQTQLTDDVEFVNSTELTPLTCTHGNVEQVNYCTHPLTQLADNLDQVNSDESPKGTFSPSLSLSLTFSIPKHNKIHKLVVVCSPVIPLVY